MAFMIAMTFLEASGFWIFEILNKILKYQLCSLLKRSWIFQRLNMESLRVGLCKASHFWEKKIKKFLLIILVFWSLSLLINFHQCSAKVCWIIQRKFNQVLSNSFHMISIWIIQNLKHCTLPKSWLKRDKSHARILINFDLFQQPFEHVLRHVGSQVSLNVLDLISQPFLCSNKSFSAGTWRETIILKSAAQTGSCYRNSPWQNIQSLPWPIYFVVN